MGWRERLSPASFRGVPFHVESSDFGGGRRTVRHEFPHRSTPFSEDLGRKARDFGLECYVVGADYMDARDALISALEAYGPGELVHPYYGTRRVVPASFRVRETSQDGGYAVFSISFEETELAPEFPGAEVASLELVSLAGEAALARLRTLLSIRRAISLPTTVLAKLGGVISGALWAIDAALSMVPLAVQELAALRAQVIDMVASAASLAREPVDLYDQLKAVFDGLDLPARLGVDALLAAYGYEPDVERPPATTATRQAEQESYDQVLRTIRLLSVVHAAKLAPAATFDSYDAAVSVRDSIAEALDEQAECVDDDELFALLGQLRSDLVRSVPGDASDLPRITSYTAPESVPSLVLAHRLYGSVEREADLLARNRVVRPGFVPGGDELEVLSDG